MSPDALLFVQGAVLVYLAVRNLLQAGFAVLGLRSAIRSQPEPPEVALKDLVEREFYQPFSILIPAFNEGQGIVPRVRSMLSLRFPEFEVVVSNDGSTDATLRRLIDAFSLVEVPQIYRRRLDTAEVRRIYRSLLHPNLTVIDKAKGGRADALNAALNLARFPLVCSVDAGALLDGEALLRVTRLFLEDGTVVGVVSPGRPLNGAVVREGRVVEERLPGRWVERFQVVEHARALLIGRSRWSRFGAPLVDPGTFGVFRRESMIEIGGYATDTVTEDLEMVMRFHRRSVRMLFHPGPICRTEVPSDLATLRSQRHRWQRGLRDALWRHRGMLGNPRYGRAGLLGVPSLWFFEALSPVVDVAGYQILVATLAMGVLNVPFAVLFLILSALCGVLLSQLAVGIEAVVPARYLKLRDRLLLFGAAFLEALGFQQIVAWERVRALLSLRKSNRRGEERHQGGHGPASADRPFEPSVVSHPSEITSQGWHERRHQPQG